MQAAEEIAEELFFEPTFGFRALPADDPKYEIGEQMDKSFDWQNDECTGEELAGACSLDAKIGVDSAIEILRTYHGSDCAIYIIAGSSSMRGQDPDEKIIIDPHVVGIIRN